MIDENDILLDDEITDLLISSGMPANVQGFGFLKSAISICVKKPEIINQITKGLYPLIAQTYGTTSQLVERSIRHCITKAYESGALFQSKDFSNIKNVDLTENRCNSNVIAIYAQITRKRLHEKALAYRKAEQSIASNKRFEEVKAELELYKKTYGAIKKVD